MKKYTIKYYDLDHSKQEFLTPAHDSYDAKSLAMESIKYLNEHPHSIYSISSLSGN